MELSSLEANGQDATSASGSNSSGSHALQLQQTQSLPNLNTQQRQPLLSVRLPPIDHIRGRTNIMHISQANESEPEISNSGSGEQHAETRNQRLPGAEDPSLSDNRELIQQIFYQTQLNNSLVQQASARNEDMVNSGVNHRNSPFDWNSAMQQRRAHV